MFKKFVAFFAFSILIGTTFAQSGYHRRQTFRPITFEERMAPLNEYKKVYDEASATINALYDYIVEVLGYDIDNQLRQEMNRELSLLDKAAEDLNGYPGRAKASCDAIYRNVQKEIANYNNRARIAQERERRAAEEQAKRAATEQAKRAAEERARNEQTNAKPQNWTGTGFALRDGYIVTNYHIVDEAKSIFVQGIKGDFTVKYKATIIATDKYNDLALLQISDNRFNGFGIIPYNVKTSVSDVGEDVFVLGYPLTSTMGDEIKLTTGVISSKTGFLGDVSLYQISAPLQPGNSGAPLFDNKGNLIGIVNAKHEEAENVGYAIKTSYLKNLIESSISTSILPNINQIAGLSLPEKVKSLKNYVFMITCSSIRASGNAGVRASDNSSNVNVSKVLSIVNKPYVRSTTADARTRIKSIMLKSDCTIVEITSNNRSESGYYQWITIDKNTSLLINGTRYAMTKAEGIKIAPDKTYYSYAGQEISFYLYFPPIPSSATSMDLIEPNSSWKFYGIKIR